MVLDEADVMLNMGFRDDIEIEEAIDLFFGPLIYRMLVGHASIDDNTVRSIIDHAVRGLRNGV